MSPTVTKTATREKASAIDWARMAEPQADQYDTEICLQVAKERGYVRPAVGAQPTLFDGQVVFGNADASFAGFPPSFVVAPIDHPNIKGACELLPLWPTGYMQFKGLIDTVYLYIDESQTNPELIRTYSNLGPSGPCGAVAATINDLFSLAECFVHEMAHHKLRLCGVELLDASQILRNGPDELYPSPIRLDRLRPMTAVLHAQYSYTYVVALVIAIEQSGKAPHRRRLTSYSLAKNLPKLEFGLRLINASAMLDDAGVGFLKGLTSWSKRLFKEGYEILDQLKTAPLSFSHPLDVSDGGRRAGCPFRRKQVRQQEVDDQLVLTIVEQPQAFSLNESGRAIWELCDGIHTPQEIGQVLSERYQCSANALMPDIQQATQQLHRLGFLGVDGPLAPLAR